VTADRIIAWVPCGAEPVTERCLHAIRASWGHDTSASSTWSPLDPARGQCAVTALVVQDLFGGDLRRGVVEGDSHYWNVLPDGTELDLTREQFSDFRPISVEPRSRDYVLSYPDTRLRYERLRSRVEALRADQ
jgi:hypothetical protein